MKRKKLYLILFIMSFLLLVTGCNKDSNNDKQDPSSRPGKNFTISEEKHTIETNHIKFTYDENFRALNKDNYRENKEDIDKKMAGLGTSTKDMFGKLLKNDNSLVLLKFDDQVFFTQLTYIYDTNALFKAGKNNDQNMQESLKKGMMDSLPETASDVRVETYKIHDLDAIYVEYNGKASFSNDIGLKSVRVNFLKDKTLHMFTFNTTSQTFEDRIEYLKQALDTIEFK